MSFSEEIRKFRDENEKDLNFSFVSFARINFETKETETKSFFLPEYQEMPSEIIYDLASLTKPLVMGLAKLLRPELFNKDLSLLMNHRAGLPAYGTLSKKDWAQHIESFFIKESETLYSDYSAMRFMLEFDKVSEDSLEKICREYYKGLLVYWLFLGQDLKDRCAITGQRGQYMIQGEVHDPNAYNISSFSPHAGFFGKIQNLADALLKLDADFKLLETVPANIIMDHRFADSFDRVQDTSNTLAGIGCSENTFGHLGFTGTSFWIDPDKKLGWAMCSNATETYWYERKFLNGLRRRVGEMIWSGSKLN